MIWRFAIYFAKCRSKGDDFCGVQNVHLSGGV